MTPDLPRRLESLRLRAALDRILSIDAKRRFRLLQTAVALAVTISGVAAMLFLAARGLSPWPRVAAWTVWSVGGYLAFFVAIRSGWSERFADPALTWPQVAFGTACCATAYAIAGAARGATFPLLMIVLMFGVFSLTPRQMLAISAYTLLLFVAAVTYVVQAQPLADAWAVEGVHLWMLATMMPVVSVLAWQLRRLRARLEQRTDELAASLERNQFLATRDELTGLVNRRQMTELLARERLRVTRGSAGFCVALIDLDHFKRVNDRHGHAAGDSVLCAFAAEAERQVRAADVVARWGGEEFLLFMPDSALLPAAECADRLRRAWRVRAIEIGPGVLHETFSAGVVQHAAGEEIARTIERADAALYRAKAGGRDRVISD